MVRGLDSVRGDGCFKLTSMNASIRTDAIVCAVFGFMTAAPSSRPRDCAVNTLSTSENRLLGDVMGSV